MRDSCHLSCFGLSLSANDRGFPFLLPFRVLSTNKAKKSKKKTDRGFPFLLPIRVLSVKKKK